MPAPHAPMPSAEALAEPMRSRWSPSVFDDRHELEGVELETLLHAARWAPSEGNSQPWAFFVAERGSKSHDVLVGHLSRGNATWVPRASVVLITATQVAPDEDGNGGGRYTAYDPARRPPTSPCRRARWGCTPTSSPASTRTRCTRTSASPTTSG